jgi:hypothetical protein
MKGRLFTRAALGACLLATLISVSLAALAADGAYVKGAVTRAGRPVRSAWVVVTQNGEEKGRSLTGDDGKYYIGDLNEGVYDVVVKQGPRDVFTGRLTLPQDRVYNVEVAGP